MAFPGADLFNTQMAMAESGGRDIGYHNPARSSAAGRFGITDATWAGLARNYPDLGLTPENRLDPAANQRAQEALTAENARTLRSKGVDPSPGMLSLTHFLGPQAATAFASADPNAPVFDVLARAVGRDKAQQFIAANPEVLGGPRTVQSVMDWNTRRVGGASAPSQPSQGLPGVVQATKPPDMPSDFGTPTGPNPQAQTVDRTGREGDPLVSLGMGLMSGRDWRDGMAKGGAGYAQAQAQLAQDQRTNAGLADSQAGRDADAPSKAAGVASLRAKAWADLNPTITPAQALAANVTLKTSGDQNATSVLNNNNTNATSLANNANTVDATILGQRNTAEIAAAQRALAAKQFEEGAKTQQTFVLPGDTAGAEQHIVATTNKNGDVTYRNLSTGQELPNLPPGAQSSATYNAGTAHQVRAVTTATKDVKAMFDEATASLGRVETINRAMTDIGASGSNVGPGYALMARRALALATGQGTEPQQLAQMSLDAVAQSVIRGRAAGLGPMSDADRKSFTSDMAKIDTDPKAAMRVLETMRLDETRKGAMADAWSKVPVHEQNSILASPGGFQSWKLNAMRDIMSSEKTATPAPNPNAPKASSFWK